MKNITIPLEKIYKKPSCSEFKEGVKTTVEFVSQIDKISIIEEILQNFEFKNEEDKSDVKLFLQKNAFLCEFVLESRTKIKEYFCNKFKLFLEIEKDPEENFEELFVVIKTHKPLKEAFRCLDKLDKEWFLKIFHETKNLLNITIETKDEF